MADIKISALPAASTLTGAETIPLVQGGVTKKVTTDQFLTAANPSYTGTLTGGTGVVNLGSGQLVKDASGNVGVGTVSPGAKLHIEQLTYATPGLTLSATSETSRKYQLSMVTGGNFALTDTAAAAQRFVVDASGNLGLGVIPSAWGGGRIGFDVGNVTALFNDSSGASNFAMNAYWSGTQYVYKITAAASMYEAGLGTHKWFTAPTGTAGNPISFTQAMTLDVSGNLGVGTASPTFKIDAAATGECVIRANGGAGHGGALCASTGGTTIAVIGDAATIVGGAAGTTAMVYGSVPLAFGVNRAERARIDASGNLIQTVNTTAATLSTNGTLTFSLVSDTSLRVSVRGSDGVTRTATLTLA